MDKDLVDKILHEADIVTTISAYIPVINKGRGYVALCPFHDDKHPSMSISKDKQIFKCFVCNTSGNSITFVQQYEKISFDEAARKVAEMIGLTDERLNKKSRAETIDPSLKPYYACINDLEQYYQYGLTIAEGKEAMDYLASRNIDANQIAKYGIGYSPLDGKKTIQYLRAKGHSLHTIEGIGITLVRSAENVSDSNAGRVMFPLRNADGQVVGFSARRIKKDDTAKYINSPETPIFHKGSLLYNYSEAKRSARKDGYVYLLEGFMDVMALEKAGITSAVALMGTSLTSEHIKMLRRLGCEVRVCLDGDAPGQEGMMKITTLLNKADIPFRLVSYGDDLRDPDDILQESGKEALLARMDNLVDSFDFQLNYYTNTKPLKTAEDKKKVLYYFLEFLKDMEPGLIRDNYIAKLSKATGFEMSLIRDKANVRRRSVQEEEEATISVEQTEFEILHPEQIVKKRLLKAEREMLYYMLSSVEAVKYFEKNIDSFYYPVYNSIANFIVEYVDENQKSVNVSSLIGEISNKGGDDIDELISKVSEVSGDNIHPPLVEGDTKLFDDCAIAIKEEKEKIHDKKKTEEALSGKDLEEQKALLASYALRQKARNAKKSKKK